MEDERQTDREKKGEYKQRPPGGEGGQREGRRVRKGGPGPLLHYRLGRAGEVQGGQRREGARSSLRPPVAAAWAPGQQDAGL